VIRGIFVFRGRRSLGQDLPPGRTHEPFGGRQATPLQESEREANEGRRDSTSRTGLNFRLQTPKEQQWAKENVFGPWNTKRSLVANDQMGREIVLGMHAAGLILEAEVAESRKRVIETSSDTALESPPVEKPLIRDLATSRITSAKDEPETMCVDGAPGHSQTPN
jgi:hypothetical protein